MSQQDDINRYLSMKIADWVSVSNPSSAGFDAGFVASISDAMNKGLIPVMNQMAGKPGHVYEYGGAPGGIFGGPSISGKDKVS